MRNEPDGVLGAVVASESLGLTDTMINGAGGCRSRSQIMLHDLIPDYEPECAGCCGSKYFGRQSRLPCTYLNGDDVIFGAGPKISAGVASVAEATGRRAVLIDTLGASLLCTDYAGLTGSESTDPVTIEGDLSSMRFCEGFDRCTASLMRVAPIESGEDGTVNVLGYSIADTGWQTGAAGLGHLLSLMGVRARFLSCRLPPQEVLACGAASLNVMVRPECCRETASVLESRFGIRSLRPSMGAPVGYPAIRQFLKEVGEALGRDPAPALKEVDREASAVHKVLMNFDRAPFALHVKPLEIDAESSTAWPLLRWLRDTFGMVPRRISLADDEYLPEISGYLESAGYPEALDGPCGDSDFVFTDGMAALEGRLSGGYRSYVEVRMPRGRHLDLMGRTVVGTDGCRYILDEMMNGVMRFRCGQPTDVDLRPGYCEK